MMVLQHSTILMLCQMSEMRLHPAIFSLLGRELRVLRLEQEFGQGRRVC